MAAKASWMDCRDCTVMVADCEFWMLSALIQTSCLPLPWRFQLSVWLATTFWVTKFAALPAYLITLEGLTRELTTFTTACCSENWTEMNWLTSLWIWALYQ